MALKNNLFLLAFFSTQIALAENYCEEVDYIQSSMPMMSAYTGPESLLNEKEKQDPLALQKLASQSGQHGHSELGYRYLARLFGYDGEFREDTNIKDELAKKNYPLEVGLLEAWDKWVVNAKKRLTVPLGPVDEIPEKAGPDIFFEDVADQLKYTKCIQDEIGTSLCEKYINDGRELGPGDRVSFGLHGNSKICKVVHAPWRLEQEKLLNNAHIVKGDPKNISGAASSTGKKSNTAK
ncbi:MAG: hypothetical protein M9962_14615 [Oligoflexia bacterium]|nr:hypothetical protein [Oligoflexia bacterium]